LASKVAVEKIVAYGHPNIQSIHPTTLMITKDRELSKNGDCVIAVGADKSLVDLSPAFKEALKRPDAKLTITLEADGLKEQITAEGSPKLTLTNPTDIVVRKSDYVSDRTLAIHADKASSDLPRDLVEKLKNPQQKIKISLTVCG
jgi:uncharacterized protein